MKISDKDRISPEEQARLYLRWLDANHNANAHLYDNLHPRTDTTTTINSHIERNLKAEQEIFYHAK